jgi:hypothetical protein
LVEIYKNDVFAGSTNCQNGSYNLQIDLFDGRNDLVAKVFDSLNQAGPNSTTVTVFYRTIIPSTGAHVSLTSQYSKRGADPGDILSWPVTLSGGTGPFAISVDWGDKSNPDLLSQEITGNIILQHSNQSLMVAAGTVVCVDHLCLLARPEASARGYTEASAQR